MISIAAAISVIVLWSRFVPELQSATTNEDNRQTQLEPV